MRTTQAPPRLDLVRAGVARYDSEPPPDRNAGPRPTMTVRSRVILTKRVPAGTRISHSHDYATTARSTLALVPVGYADGISRSAAGRAQVRVHGRRCPVAGR